MAVSRNSDSKELVLNHRLGLRPMPLLQSRPLARNSRAPNRQGSFAAPDRRYRGRAGLLALLCLENMKSLPYDSPCWIRREHVALSVIDNCREPVDDDDNNTSYVRFRTLIVRMVLVPVPARTDELTLAAVVHPSTSPPPYRT
jgi:hypothetical protein